MIDYGSKYTNNFYVGISFYYQWSFSPASTPAGNTGVYRTLLGAGA